MRLAVNLGWCNRRQGGVITPMIIFLESVVPGFQNSSVLARDTTILQRNVHVPMFVPIIGSVFILIWKSQLLSLPDTSHSPGFSRKGSQDKDLAECVGLSQ